jgi:hypothetical protein
LPFLFIQQVMASNLDLANSGPRKAQE